MGGFIVKEYCEECDGKGYIEYPDYDWDENILETDIRVECECSVQVKDIDTPKKIIIILIGKWLKCQ